MGKYDVRELRCSPRSVPLPEDVNTQFVAMLSEKLDCKEFADLCAYVQKNRLFGEILVTDATGEHIVEVTSSSGVLTQAIAIDIIGYKVKRPLRAVLRRSIINPALHRPRKEKGDNQ